MNELLFTPAKIGNMELKNRIIMSAMHLGYAQRRFVSMQDLGFYTARAKGGAGAITLVASVNEQGGPMDMHCLHQDVYNEGLQKLVDIMHAEDCKCIVQLFHCGRNGHPAALQGKLPLSPSTVASPIYKVEPKEMTAEEIFSTIRDFGSAAARCKAVGIDAVEISCSAGYLLSQFLSPIVNLRQDEWGGSPEKRMRFPNEVIKEVRRCVGPNYPVLLKISASDMLPGGYGIEETKAFIRQIPYGSIDAITVTGGWHEAPVPQISFHVPEGGFAYLAKDIKSTTVLPVVACNRINNREIAEKVLQDGCCDFVGCGRAFLADSDFAENLRKGLPFNKCQGCNKGCIERVLKLKPVICAYNCRVGRETEPEWAQIKKTVLVVGGGPSGMEAARSAAKMGHRTVLCTNETVLGGRLNVASIPPFKQDLRGYINVLEGELLALGVDIRLNASADRALIDEVKPTHVILALGANAIIPKIPGMETMNTITAEDALTADGKALARILAGPVVIIGGGSVGLETAEYLAEKSGYLKRGSAFTDRYVKQEMLRQLIGAPDITVVEMDKKVGRNMGSTKWILLQDLAKLNVDICTETKVVSAGDGKLFAESAKGRTEFPAETVIFALGYRPADSNELIGILKEKAIEYTLVGDSNKIGDVMSGTADAYQAVRNI